MNQVKNIYTRLLRRLSRSMLLEQQKEFEVVWSKETANPYARYDRQTFYLINQLLEHNSNTIDVGAHVGEVLEKMIDASPAGTHYAFEPLPHLYEKLKSTFGGKANIQPFALGDVSRTASFNYVVSNPYYSGLLKQHYPGEETIEEIEVEVRRLDEVIPIDLPIKLIKIDVEGAEFLVLKGASGILKKWKPVIIYEQGLGSAEYYETTPENFFDFITSFGYQVSLMDYYISGLESFSKEEYCKQFYKRYNYYFIAY